MEAAGKLGVSQPYLSLLEKGDRKVSAKLARKAVTLYRLSPVVLRFTLKATTAKPRPVPAQTMAEELSALGIPGFLTYDRVASGIRPRCCFRHWLKKIWSRGSLKPSLGLSCNTQTWIGTGWSVRLNSMIFRTGSALSRPLQFASLSAREIRRKWLRLNDTRVFWSPRGLPNRIRSVMNHFPKPRENGWNKSVPKTPVIGMC
jgi:hypothetical protein